MKLKPFLLSALLSLLGLACPQSARGQFIGYTSPQTVTSTAFNNVSCTGSTQRTLIPNLGQTTHFITMTNSVLPVGIAAAIQGSYDGILFFDISNAVSFTNGTVQPVAEGQGYYPVVAVRVNCSSAVGKFTIFYTGTSTGLGPLSGSAVVSQSIQNLTIQASDGTSAAFQIPSPFANAGGVVSLQQNGAMVAGSFISVTCDTASAATQTFGPFPIPTIGGSNFFVIPAFPCATPQINFQSGGASANTYNLYYSFAQPGFATPAFNYTHITTTTATAAKATSGYLHTLTVNTGAAGTVSIFDLNGSNCTGTPATNTIAVLTTTTAAETFIYDVNTLNGICVKASVAMDLTVSTQ